MFGTEEEKETIFERKLNQFCTYKKGEEGKEKKYVGEKTNLCRPLSESIIACNGPNRDTSLLLYAVMSVFLVFSQVPRHFCAPYPG